MKSSFDNGWHKNCLSSIMPVNHMSGHFFLKQAENPNTCRSNRNANCSCAQVVASVASFTFPLLPISAEPGHCLDGQWAGVELVKKHDISNLVFPTHAGPFPQVWTVAVGCVGRLKSFAGLNYTTVMGPSNFRVVTKSQS